MGSSKAFLLFPLLCISLTTIVAAGCGHDRKESLYPSLADADKYGAITRGWIPDFLPTSSRAIHEVHYSSPSKEWCSFEFGPYDSKRLREALKSVDVLPPSVKRVPSPGASWWPVMFEGDLDLEKIRGAGLDVYMIERPETSVTTEIFIVVIDWMKGRGFFYSTTKPPDSGRSPGS